VEAISYLSCPPEEQPKACHQSDQTEEAVQFAADFLLLGFGFFYFL
jgi:hypothetical protein